MKRLAIETATHACSVALQIDDEIIERYEFAPRRHGDLILPWAEELLATAGIARQQLDGVVLSRGPGSFTSLRLGLSAGTAIAFALDLPVYPVSTLAILAWCGHQLTGANALVAALDARMQEVYAAAYRADAGSLQLLGDEYLIAPSDFVLPADASITTQWHGVGNGFSAENGQLQQNLHTQLEACYDDCWPRASAALHLAQEISPVAAERFQPTYLRDRVAEPAHP